MGNETTVVGIPPLRLVSESSPCPTCKGMGKVRCPATITANGLVSTSTGAWIPCPDCKGSKIRV